MNRTSLLPAPWFMVALVALGHPAPAVSQPVEPPPPMEARSIEFPPFQEFTLDNGLQVVILSYGSQPVMSARLYAPGGSSLEPRDRAGLAGLAAEVLTRGTETRSATEISEAIEGVGGSLGASGGQDWLTVSASVLTEHAATAFELLGDVVRHATFPEEEVELARRRTLSSLQASLGQPQAIAQRHFSALVYGAEHPYGVSPTPRTVEAITRDDLLSFRDRVLQPDGALLLVAGRVDRSRMEELVRRHLGDWEPGDAVEVELPTVPTSPETRIHLIHRPGSSQSVIALGHPGVEPDHPDYFPLVVMNRILGGGSDARLFRILREEKGWTYGAYSQFTRPADRGVFRATTEVRPEVTDSTLVELLNQVERIRTEPVPAEELEAARNYLAGSFPLRLETAGQVAGQLASNLLLGLPLEDLTRYPEGIRSVTAEEVQRVAREHLHPDQATVVVVGDGGAILDQLEPLAPVDIYDVEGNPIERDELLAAAEAMDWDASRLEEGTRRYDIYIQGTAQGSAEYRLERDGGDWVSTASQTSAMGSQETRLRFSTDDLSPRGIEIRGEPGPAGMAVELSVDSGRIRGTLELPPQMGGNRDMDQELGEGVLLPGMEEYALAVAELSEGARISIPYLNLLADEQGVLEARVRGQEEVSVPAGTFQVWRVELTGGQVPMVLYLRADAPHMLIRQEYQGQPIRLDLTSIGPL